MPVYELSIVPVFWVTFKQRLIREKRNKIQLQNHSINSPCVAS